MHPIVAVKNIEGIYAKHILFLHPSRDLALGGESLVEKLCSLLVVYVAEPKRRVYPSHLFLDFLVYAASGEQAEILTKAPPVFIV